MNARLIALLAVVLGLGALTGAALMESGYWGVITVHFRTWGGLQVLTDLVIRVVLAMIWMVRNAARQRLPVWPFLLITLAAGSFGPLLYLVVREARGRGTA
ncbi:MAG: DUF2834 domain-containing protein [Acidobacteria bacterium]|nr:DUF2834 domain-containing protein [Acidobacteriota bacterium]